MLAYSSSGRTMVLKAASLMPLCLVCLFLLSYPRLLDALAVMRLIC